MLEGRHYQNAYVTCDLESATAEFRKYADVRKEVYYESRMEVETPAGPRISHNKLIFIWVGDLQYELIEPIEDIGNLYSAVLTRDSGLKFHHICMRIDDWDEFRGRVDQQPFPLAFEGEAPGVKFLYLDARAQLGHYVEYCWMSDEVWAFSGGR